MQFIVRAPILLVCIAHATAGTTNPVSKVLDLLSDMTAKVTAEGKTAQEEGDKFQALCKEQITDKGYEIKEETRQVEQLKAAIEDASADAQSASAKIDDHAASVSASENTVKKLTAQREKAAADHSEAKADLEETISMLKRAINVLSKSLKGGAALVQEGAGADSLVQALTAMVDASALSSADVSKLTALVQQHAAANDGDEDEDGDLGAPAAAVYQSKSGGIVDTLEDLLDKAEEELRDARKEEMQSIHNYQMEKQAQDDARAFAQKGLEEQKGVLAESNEKKASSTGQLDKTAADLASDKKFLVQRKQDCAARKKKDALEATKRGEELEALAHATKAVQDATGAASDITYNGAASFLQRAQSESSHDLAVVRLLRDLSKKHRNAPALTQLAARVAAVMRSRRGDVFGKVKGLISDMIAKLQQQQAEEATEKAWCDAETSKTTATEEEKSSESEKLTTKIDSMSARSKKLQEEVKELQSDLAKLASTMSKAGELRTEEHATYEAQKKDMKAGMEGVALALNVLKEYYGENAGGASSGIIGMLEVVQDDFASQDSRIETEEVEAAAEFEEATQAARVEKAAKEQDVKYKTKETASLAKKISEASADRDNVEAELKATRDYLKELNDRCVAKPETYEERAAARDAEIAGLKEALQILEGQASLLQRKASLRGLNRHVGQ